MHIVLFDNAEGYLTHVTTDVSTLWQQIPVDSIRNISLNQLAQ